MTNKDAGFLLGACRPNGADSGDAEFSEALAQAARDPALKAWFDDQRQFDSAIAARLQAAPIPPDLRSRILTGGRVSRPVPWFSRVIPARLWAIAAMLALFAGLTIWHTAGLLHHREGWEDQALAALSQLVSGQETFDAKSSSVAELQQWLHANGSPTVGAVPEGLRHLSSIGCKSIVWNGHPISLICFHGPGGEMVHLAMTERAGLENPPPEGHPEYEAMNGWRVARWSQGEMAMMLITKAPESQLRALLALVL